MILRFGHWGSVSISSVFLVYWESQNNKPANMMTGFAQVHEMCLMWGIGDSKWLVHNQDSVFLFTKKW